MMGITERDVENLLREATFPNPTHKEALRERLFNGIKTLSLDDLALVAAGTGEPTSGDDREVAVCDNCKTYSYSAVFTGEICPRCGKKFSRIVKAKDLPANYDMM